MKILSIIILETGFQILIRKTDRIKNSYWGTTGYEKGVGFYNNPQISLDFWKFRIRIKLFSTLW